MRMTVGAFEGSLFTMSRDGAAWSTYNYESIGPLSLPVKENLSRGDQSATERGSGDEAVAAGVIR